MKLCIAGNNNIAVDILLFSLSIIEKHQVCVVLNKNDKRRNTWQKSLGFYAQINNIQILKLEDVQELYDITFISAQFDVIVKPHLFNSKKLFNLHFSYLPNFKGMYPSILPILFGEKSSGVTLHLLDQGIDTGDIISQTKIDIENMNSEELYAINLKSGTDLVCKNLGNLMNSEFIAHIQQSKDSYYFSKSSFDYNKKNINSFQTAHQISRFVKALKFRPYQLAEFNDDQIYKTQISENKSNQKPGTILCDNEEFVELCTIDYNIRLFKDYFNQLIICCQENNVEKAKTIIQYIENPEEITKEGWTPLMIAAYYGSYEMVKLLVEHNSKVTSSNLNGTSVLMFAKDAYLRNKNFQIIQFLLQNGADIAAVDIYGKSIFDYTDDSELIALLKSYSHD